MRRAVTAIVIAIVLGTIPAGSTPRSTSPAGFTSPNVTWVANIPIDSPGVGARLVHVGDQARLYVTGVTGLTIYDVTDPTLPVPLGHTQLPNWENEDVSVSADGSTVIIANDVEGPSYVIDASTVAAPHVVGLIPTGAHIITCVRVDCSWAYGNRGHIIDLRDRANPIVAGDWRPARVKLKQQAHDLNMDDAGFVISDTQPRLMLDPRRDPVHPRLVTMGEVPLDDHLAYQHNNLRPSANAWHPRRAGDTSAALRPGELLLSNGETNFKPECDGSTNGPFATWSIKNWDKGAQMKPLSVFRPIHNGEYVDGDPAVNLLGCSGHWFSVRNGIVAAGWYEHGTRFLKVDPHTGSITEVGFFEPLAGSTSAAHWIDDHYVITVDYQRGIDILRFDASAQPPTRAEVVQSWLAKLHTFSLVSEQARYLCRLRSE